MTGNFNGNDREQLKELREAFWYYVERGNLERCEILSNAIDYLVKKIEEEENGEEEED